MLSITQVIFIGTVAPYKDRHTNNLEMVNEILTMEIMYHIFCFTDFVGDEQTRYYIGYSCLAANIGHLSYNMYHILRTQLKDMHARIKLQLTIRHMRLKLRARTREKFSHFSKQYVHRRKCAYKDHKKQLKVQAEKMSRRQAKRLLFAQRGRELFSIPEEAESHDQTNGLGPENENVGFIARDDPYKDIEVFPGSKV